jgi:hypothetical protein
MRLERDLRNENVEIISLQKQKFTSFQEILFERTTCEMRDEKVQINKQSVWR